MKTQIKDENQEVFFEIEYLAEKKILRSSWFGDYLSVEQVQEGANLVLEGIKEHKCQLFMNDGHKVGSSWDESNEWLANEWMPQVIQAGLKKFAHILSENLYAQLSAEFMEENAQKVENIFQIKMFGTAEDAEEWLLNA